MNKSKIHHVSKEDMANWNGKATVEDLQEHTKDENLHLSEKEKKALGEIVEGGGIEGIKEGVNNVATELEQIGLNNTATLAQVITRLREANTFNWDSLSIGIATGMGLEPLMPMRGIGHLVIERRGNNFRRFLITYYGNLSNRDEIRVFIANHQDNATIPNERNWREIRTSDTQIVQSDMANNSVGTNQLVDLAVTGAKIANGTITENKLATSINLGGIKSIQRGNLSVASTSGTTSINVINISKSFLIITGFASMFGGGDWPGISSWWFGLGSTSVSASRTSFNTNPGSTIISWQVIEFN